MSHNSIRARLAFSFKAEHYDLDSVIDLDQPLANADTAPDFHLLLAKTRGIDPYSYLYEVLESHDIEFSEPTGVAALACRDGQFDWWQYTRHKREDLELLVIREIAQRILGLTDPASNPQLLDALLAAYRAGKAGTEPGRD
jgi:hypothetical protein